MMDKDMMGMMSKMREHMDSMSEMMNMMESKAMGKGKAQRMEGEKEMRKKGVEMMGKMEKKTK